MRRNHYNIFLACQLQGLPSLFQSWSHVVVWRKSESQPPHTITCVDPLSSPVVVIRPYVVLYLVLYGDYCLHILFVLSFKKKSDFVSLFLLFLLFIFIIFFCVYVTGHNLVHPFSYSCVAHNWHCLVWVRGNPTGKHYTCLCIINIHFDAVRTSSNWE